MNFDLALPDSAELINRNEGKMRAELAKLNEISEAYALVLSEKDIEMLAQRSAQSLENSERVEFGKCAVVKVAEKFMNSSYITQNEYPQTLAELTEIFYEVKSQSLEMLSDEDVIDIMFDCFERFSGGDLFTLMNRDMELLCRRIRDSARGIPCTEEYLAELEDLY